MNASLIQVGVILLITKFGKYKIFDSVIIKNITKTNL